MMRNAYGIDSAYFRKELNKLSRDIDMYPAVELARYFERLADVASCTVISNGSLSDTLQDKQVRAGEQAVINNLKRIGLST